MSFCLATLPPLDLAMMFAWEEVGESLFMEQAAFSRIIEPNRIHERDLRQIRKAKNEGISRYGFQSRLVAYYQVPPQVFAWKLPEKSCDLSPDISSKEKCGHLRVETHWTRSVLASKH